MFLKISHYSQEKTCVAQTHFNKVAYLRSAILLKKTPTQVFPHEYCEIFKNILFYRTHPVPASESSNYASETTLANKKYEVTCLGKPFQGTFLLDQTFKEQPGWNW